jgi:glutathione S-transferase
MTATLSIDERSVAVAWEKVQAAGTRFRAELQPSGYLASDGFNVADLTLAALLSPAVAPPEFPYPQPQRDHPRLAPLRDVLDSEGLSAWTRGIYARHRGTSAEVAAAPPTCPPNQEFRVLSQGEPRGRQQRRSRHC